jgi:DNA helicase-2/ATP-dependent DNA helicase PcrA
LNVVNREIRHIEERQEKDLEPRIEGGAVEAMASPSMLDLVRNVRSTIENDDGTVMVLFRARYQMLRFIDEFIDQGIPFQLLTDQRMWTDRLTEYVEAVERVEAGEPVSGLGARRLADMLADAAFGANDRDELYDAIDAEQEAAGVEDYTDFEVDPDLITEYAPFVPEPTAAAEMLRKVTNFQEKSMRAFFAGEYQDVPTDRLRLGTIHSAKGREADHVYVSTDLTEKVVEQMAASVPDPEAIPGVSEFTKTTDPVPVLTDNERRVFYVGMSRARERLVLLENLVGGAPTLPIDVLLYNEPRESSIEEMVAEAEAPIPAD